MNKDQIIDEVYKNYLLKINNGRIYPNSFTQEEFINKCKTDPEFSEKWGLKIEERELSLDERTEWWFEYNKPTRQEKEDVGDSHSGYQEKYFDKVGVPTKLITITYNNETIESYE